MGHSCHDQSRVVAVHGIMNTRPITEHTRTPSISLHMRIDWVGVHNLMYSHKPAMIMMTVLISCFPLHIFMTILVAKQNLIEKRATYKTIYFGLEIYFPAKERKNNVCPTITYSNLESIINVFT